MSTKFQELVTENPMLIEVQRTKRRVTNSHNLTPAANKAMLATGALCYFGALVAVVRSAGSLPPVVMVMAQTAVFCFMAPALMYGAIAGERERRSWDLLLAAPISKAQIVLGKFMGSLAAIGAGVAGFMLPYLVCLATYRDGSFFAALLMQAVSISFAMLLSSFTLYVSSRTPRAMAALGTTLATMGALLLALPALATTLVRGADAELFWVLNPFYALVKLDELARPTGSEVFPWAAQGWVQTFVYLGLTAVFVTLATRTLTKADNPAGRRRGA